MLFDLGVFPDDIERRFTPRQWAAVKAEGQTRAQSSPARQRARQQPKTVAEYMALQGGA
jgi:hypothetical protein